MITSVIDPVTGNKKKLTAKEQVFAKEFPKDLNATKTAVRAKYSKKSARQLGSETLSKPYMQVAITQVLQELGITNETVMPELAKVLYQDKDLTNKRQSIRDFMQYTGQLIDKKESKSVSISLSAKASDKAGIDELRRTILDQ